MEATRNVSDTPVPTTEAADPPTHGVASTVTEEEWNAMSTVLANVLAHRTEDGYDPTILFQRKVNKRQVPDYYDVIKEPMATSVIKSKIQKKEYKNFTEFVRDFALIPYNAQVYNRAASQAYIDAEEVRTALEAELKKLVEEKVISEDVATLPYLGEIPEQDPLLPDEEEEEDSDAEEHDDEDEEDEDEDDDDGKRKRRRGARSTAAISKREAGRTRDEARDGDPDARKKRGRPPRVDTPMEARIKNIMKGIRKPRNEQNRLMVSAFERVPDKTAMPEYHAEIKSPMAMDILKRKLKRKKYTSVDHFMQDVELMFENAKQYNEDDSQVYKDAVHLQKEARVLAQQEKEKPDSEYTSEEGRIPMPSGILHNGELWKVGDWVHIQNPNDLTKPIVAQIYRTWQDAEGGKWVNACWYYRPEQTVHRFDRHFLENEVVKTGQYRDHRIEEVVDRCFVMFVTRYNKGRPRDFPADKEVYVCEARYNEEKHKLNKIKTWASCLPDEVRDKDYVMDLFDAPRKLKKVPSPIAYLLRDDQKETDDLPKPEWGAENAPPKIGAVHRRPRDPKDSPPPEPTPSPPPPPPPAPVMPTPSLPPAANGYGGDTSRNYPIAQAPVPSPVPVPTPQTHHVQTAYTPSHPTQYHAHSASPAPPTPQHVPQAPGYQPITPHVGFAAPPATAPVPQYAPRPSTYQQPPYMQPAPVGYKAPQAMEVYILSDHANNSIPADIREQFQRDEQGRVLFFTAPPLNAPTIAKKEGRTLGHSARYLAKKAEWEAERVLKRKQRDAELAERELAKKKARMEEEERVERGIAELKRKAVGLLEDEVAAAAKLQFMALSGGQATPEQIAKWMESLTEAQSVTAQKQLEREEREKQDKMKEKTPITGMTVMLEDTVRKN
ncbi:chromatin structure-remodeling complex protein-like protein rsc1 [Sporormia fimetaria CBS 119925]|uniref:Chromatin structure-remodeling complex protein-like protein rsc1 n=1 Tax=Sporormia fimetaria CBS 119925 TaxID=1340428 RepID=A0A6A6VQL1_9PLEO|nr:chromatin structure-remodeling complex protein-like protein rsc1 [Sporormia fimetaria CBS 119925]